MATGSGRATLAGAMGLITNRAYLRLTSQSNDMIRFASRKYIGALAFMVLGGGALCAAYGVENRLARFYLLVCGLFCLVGAIWQLFWRDELEIDIRCHSYLRRHGLWPMVREQRGPVEDITGVELMLAHPQDNRGGQLEVWTVGLRFKNITEPLLVAEFLRAEERARALAASLASQLRVSLTDRSSMNRHLSDYDCSRRR